MASPRTARLLAALLTFTGIAHFVAPQTFERIVPEALGNARFWVYASGVAEVAGAASIAYRSTRRWGGYWCAALFVAVFPANIYMAIDRDATNVPAWISWARLPLQPLLIWWALRVASSGERRNG